MIFYSKLFTEHMLINPHRFLPRCMQCRRGLAMRNLTVCLSAKRVDFDKTEERSVQIFIPYERPFSLVFLRRRIIGGGNPFFLKFWVNWPPLSEIADFEPIFGLSASAVTPSEKKFN